MRRPTTYLTIFILATSLLLQGCSFLIGAAAGGAAGYMLKDNGYEVRSPVTKESS